MSALATQFQSGPMVPAPSSPVAKYSSEELQRLVDRAACFHLFLSPGGVGFTPTVHRFDIEMAPPRKGTGVRASNTVGDELGHSDYRCNIIPYAYYALPNVEPPAIALDPFKTQRFALHRWKISIGDGRDSFECFGTGRTFPMQVGGSVWLAAAAVANVISGTGKFAGLEGNITFCGELVFSLINDLQLMGHVIVRFVDPQGVLRSSQPLPPRTSRPSPDDAATYLTWVGQKGKGADQANRPSIGPDGQVRGMNIPTQLKRVRFGAAIDPHVGFQAMNIEPREIIGREIGFGHGSVPGAPDAGTPLRPYLFEGVGRYTLFDTSSRPLGALTTNIIEGRRFDVQLAPDLAQPGWRFGFFGPIVFGSGIFEGMQGIYYGASGSFFQPPPADHLVTHLYSVRLYDPERRLRA
jgi:hypothetical protein